MQFYGQLKRPLTTPKISRRSCHDGQCLPWCRLLQRRTATKKETFDKMKDADLNDHQGWLGRYAAALLSSARHPAEDKTSTARDPQATSMPSLASRRRWLTWLLARAGLGGTLWIGPKLRDQMARGQTTWI